MVNFNSKILEILHLYALESSTENFTISDDLLFDKEILANNARNTLKHFFTWKEKAYKLLKENKNIFKYFIFFTDIIIYFLIFSLVRCDRISLKLQRKLWRSLVFIFFLFLVTVSKFWILKIFRKLKFI